MAFIGSVNAEVRRWLGNIGPLFTGRSVVVGCSGDFTIEQLLTPHKPSRVWGNDVSLYSAALGAYLTGQPFRLDVKSEKLTFIKPFLQTSAGKAASVLLLSEALQYSPEKNPFQVRLWNYYRTHFGVYHEKTVLKLERLRSKIYLDRYSSMDIFDLLDQLLPEALIIAFLPTYKGGYERLFRRLEESLDWDRPTYRMIDDDRKEAIISKLQAFACLMDLVESKLVNDINSPTSGLPVGAVVDSLSEG
jgi:hypothetical protein